MSIKTVSYADSKVVPANSSICAFLCDFVDWCQEETRKNHPYSPILNIRSAHHSMVSVNVNEVLLLMSVVMEVDEHA